MERRKAEIEEIRRGSFDKQIQANSESNAKSAALSKQSAAELGKIRDTLKASLAEAKKKYEAALQSTLQKENTAIRKGVGGFTKTTKKQTKRTNTKR